MVISELDKGCIWKSCNKYHVWVDIKPKTVSDHYEQTPSAEYFIWVCFKCTLKQPFELSMIYSQWQDLDWVVASSQVGTLRELDSCNHCGLPSKATVWNVENGHHKPCSMSRQWQHH